MKTTNAELKQITKVGVHIKSGWVFYIISQYTGAFYVIINQWQRRITWSVYNVGSWLGPANQHYYRSTV